MSAKHTRGNLFYIGFAVYAGKQLTLGRGMVFSVALYIGGEEIHSAKISLDYRIKGFLDKNSISYTLQAISYKLFLNLLALNLSLRKRFNYGLVKKGGKSTHF
jgi:hypothetical protein